jgi:tagatose 1,6-diphosphate aldolase
MELSAGKLWGMRRLADAGGRWRMIANDQRTPLIGPIAKKRGTETAAYDDIARVKEILARHLAPLASAILIDPLFGYPASIQNVPPTCGLMVALEHTVTEQTPGGRLTRDIPDWSVPKIRRLGADAVKILVWYRAEAAEEVRKRQMDYVRAASRACREFDLVFLLELLVYPLPDESPEAFRQNRSNYVLNAVRDFLPAEFGVDIYKLEPVTDLAEVVDPDGTEAAPSQSLYDELGSMMTRPWVLLSAGATAENFRRSLIYAYRAGASGYLCGRAVWSVAFDKFPDWGAMEKSMIAEALPYMHEINALTERSATPWWKHPCWGGEVSLALRGANFARDYQEIAFS